MQYTAVKVNSKCYKNAMLGAKADHMSITRVEQSRAGRRQVHKEQEPAKDWMTTGPKELAWPKFHETSQQLRQCTHTHTQTHSHVRTHKGHARLAWQWSRAHDSTGHDGTGPYRTGQAKRNQLKKCCWHVKTTATKLVSTRAAFGPGPAAAAAATAGHTHTDTLTHGQ